MQSLMITICLQTSHGATHSTTADASSETESWNMATLDYNCTAVALGRGPAHKTRTTHVANSSRKGEWGCDLQQPTINAVVI